jgi:hypothetical protein
MKKSYTNLKQHPSVDHDMTKLILQNEDSVTSAAFFQSVHTKDIDKSFIDAPLMKQIAETETSQFLRHKFTADLGSFASERDSPSPQMQLISF